jgi:hypothetical protein
LICPDSLNENLDLWKDRMAIADDFKNSDYLLFREDNFNAVMYGLGLFNKSDIKKQVNKFVPDIKRYFTNNILLYENDINNVEENFCISHKKWISNYH